MDSRDLNVGIIFLCQTALGILGNCACLCHFFLADLTGSRAKPTDVIVKHLTWANLMVLLFKGIPQTITAFGLTHFLDAPSCKLIFYFHRVARGVSFGCTCLLSVFQAIMISPSNSKFAQLKFRCTELIGPALGLCWVLHLLVNVLIPLWVTDLFGVRNRTRFREYVFCAAVGPGHLIFTFYVVLLAFVDVMCLGLMVLPSGSMVLILMKHRKRVQHIHSAMPRLSPEIRATQSILALVSSFVLFYSISLSLTTYFSIHGVSSRWMVHANVGMSACFPAFCPFLLIIQYKVLSNLCSTLSCLSCKKKACPCVCRAF